MAAIIRNNIVYAGVPDDTSIFDNYVTKAELAQDYGNVDNIHDADKHVAYATSAGDAGTVNTHTVATDVPSGAIFTDTTYTLTQDPNNGHILTFTPSSGQAISFTIPDANTTYSDLSDFTNDCGFVTNAVNDLTNYYTKSDTYTKTEVNALISAIPKFKITVVPSLESITDPDISTIYLVATGEQSQNLYTEYIYVVDETTHIGSFEQLGTQTVDLTNYYTQTEVNTLVGAKGNSLAYNSGTGVLQLKSGNTVLSSVTVTGGTTVIRLADVTGGAVSVDHNSATISWTDPEDVVLGGVTLAAWEGTKVIRKAGSAPVDDTDGTLVVNSTTKNQYSSNGYIDTGLSYDTTYYYRFFPYTDGHIVTTGSSVSAICYREVIPVPVASVTLTYDGTVQTGTFTNYDATKMDVTGNTATNAGTYTAVFTPKNDYCWQGYSQTPANVSWTIDKAEATATLSSNAVTLDPDHLTATVTISNPSGTVGTPTTSDATIATVSISGSTLTISNVNESSGDATITIPLSASENYNAGNVTIAVSAEFLKIVTWGGGTDEEICAMVAAADAGSIDLTEYWSVGDERSVSLGAITSYPSGVSDTHSAQTITMVLVASDTKTTDSTNPCYKYQYVTATSGRTYPSFIIHMKNLLANTGMMNSSGSNSGSWKSCPRRTWCNSYFKPAFESGLLPAIKAVKVRTIDVYNGSSMQETGTGTDAGDYFFLPTEKEIQGSRSYSNTTEASEFPQWQHYSTASNKIKQKSGSNYYWWLRSPYSSNSSYFCSVDSDGSAYDSIARNYRGLAVAGCV